MTRSPTNFAWVLLIGACANDPGLPWGIAELHLSATALAPAPERLTPEGWLRTSKNYGVELEILTLHVQSARFSVAANEPDLSFDPADPPSGYSLCHNGHCHTDDGRLVDYDEVEAAQRDGSNGAGSIVQAVEQEVSLLDGADTLTLGVCEQDCTLPRGTLASVTLDVTTLRVRGVAYDLTSDGRLPPEGIVIDLDAAIEASLVGLVNAPLGPGRRVGVRLHTSLRISERLFDPIDFSTSPDLGALLLESVVEEGDVAVSVERFDVE